MKTAFLVLVLLHGLIHLLGPAKAFRWAAVNQLKQPVSRAAGAFWLLGAVLFVAASCLLFFDHTSWWIVAAAGIVSSQALIVLSWRDARYGSVLNLIILVPVVIALLGALPSSHANIYRVEVTKRLAPVAGVSLVSEMDVQHLPGPVRKYLYAVGAVGRPKVYNFRAVSQGEMRRSMAGDWMEISSRQHDFFGDRARFFLIESALFGIPFVGLHAFAGDSATMHVSVASAFPIVHARGKKMTQAETVTLFNDMCLLAPATLIDTSIRWEPIDSLHVGAKFTNRAISISALLSFNQAGEMTNFVSGDRYLSADGITYEQYPWSTPAKDYRDFGGTRIAAYGEAIWHTPRGEYVYAKFDLKELEYNCSEFR